MNTFSFFTFPRSFLSFSRSLCAIRRSIPCCFVLLSICTSCNPWGEETDSYRKTAVFFPSGFGSVSKNATTALTKEAMRCCIDEEDRKLLTQTSPQTLKKIDEGKALSVEDIIHLHENGVNDDIITHYIYMTKTSYNLSHDEIRKFQQAGASQKLINYMIDTAR